MASISCCLLGLLLGEQLFAAGARRTSTAQTLFHAAEVHRVKEWQCTIAGPQPLAFSFPVTSCGKECMPGIVDGKIQIHQKFPLAFATELAGNMCVCSVAQIPKVQFTAKKRVTRLQCTKNIAAARNLCWKLYLEGMSTYFETVGSGSNSKYIPVKNVTSYNNSTFHADAEQCENNPCKSKSCQDATLPQITETMAASVKKRLWKVTSGDISNPRMLVFASHLVQPDFAALAFTGADEDEDNKLDRDELAIALGFTAEEASMMVDNFGIRTDDEGKIGLEDFNALHFIVTTLYGGPTFADDLDDPAELDTDASTTTTTTTTTDTFADDLDVPAELDTDASTTTTTTTTTDTFADDFDDPAELDTDASTTTTTTTTTDTFADDLDDPAELDIDASTTTTTTTTTDRCQPAKEFGPLHSITVEGFKGVVVNGYDKSVLDGVYVEAKDERVGCRETYWKKPEGLVLFFCEKENVWVASAASFVKRARAGKCKGFARGAVGVDILDPGHMPFDRIYSHGTGWEDLSGPRVADVAVRE